MLSVSAATALLVVLGALVLFVLGLSRWLAEPGDEGGSVSDALRELEPKIGRQRPSVKLFDSAVLVAVWVATSGIFVVVAGTPGGAPARIAVAALVGVATWWSWRRGVLAPLVARADLAEEPERGEDDDGARERAP